MKVALVHDFLIHFGGAEKVFLSLKNIFPKADIYTLLYDEKKMGQYFSDVKVQTAFIQKFPFWRKYHRPLALFMPSAIESLDLRDYDLVISSSSAYAKGLIIRPKTIHICYCHSPMRYVWDYSQKYDSPFALLRKILVHYLRIWDRSAANRVDYFIANSKTTAERIRKYYGRKSEIIYPPVSCHSEGASGAKRPKNLTGGAPTRSVESDDPCSPDEVGTIAVGCADRPAASRRDSREILPPRFARGQDDIGGNFFLIVSQLTPYKRIDLAISVCNKLEIPLIIIGQGRDEKRLKKMAGPTIKFLGWQADEVVRQYYQNCFAFLFPSDDDFGIAPVEAMSYGKPILAYRKGGATETILENITGEFFDDLAVESLADGIRRLKINYGNYKPKIIQQQAAKFSQEEFDKKIKEFVIKTVESKKGA